ncbi:MAG: hypothetical protein U0795_25290 [Pirellulales bacterium]
MSVLERATTTWVENIMRILSRLYVMFFATGITWGRSPMGAGRTRAVMVASLVSVASIMSGLTMVSGCGRGVGTTVPVQTPDGWCDEGLEACRVADWDRAWGSLNRAIDSGQLDADRYLEASCARAAVLAARGETARAHDELNRLAAEAAEPALVWSARACVYEAEGLSDRAMEAWRTAQELDPDARLPARWSWSAEAR